jgi:dUTP pyrophosphatase
MFPAIAMRDVFIPFNERICQFRLVEKQPVLEFEEVETLGNTNRGGLGEGTRHIK